MENDVGFHREHDRDFERNWHVVALQRDETQERADEIIRLREEVSRSIYQNVIFHVGTTIIVLFMYKYRVCASGGWMGMRERGQET